MYQQLPHRSGNVSVMYSPYSFLSSSEREDRQTMQVFVSYYISIMCGNKVSTDNEGKVAALLENCLILAAGLKFVLCNVRWESG